MDRRPRSRSAQLRPDPQDRQRHHLQRLCGAGAVRRGGDRHGEGGVRRRFLRQTGKRGLLRRDHHHRAQSPGARPHRCLARADAPGAPGAPVHLRPRGADAQRAAQAGFRRVGLHPGRDRRFGGYRRADVGVPQYALSPLAGHPVHLAGRRRGVVLRRRVRLPLLRRPDVQRRGGRFPLFVRVLLRPYHAGRSNATCSTRWT